MKLSPQAIELLQQTVNNSTYPGEVAEFVVEAKKFLEELKNIEAHKEK